MKKLVLIIMSFMLTISFSTTAQNRQGRRNFRNDNRQRQEQRLQAKDRAEWMAKELDLTEKQKAEITALFEKQDAKRNTDLAEMRKSRDQIMSDRQKAREEMRALRLKEMEKNQADLKEIIGEENMEKLEKIQKERRAINRAGSNRDRSDRQSSNRQGRRR